MMLDKRVQTGASSRGKRWQTAVVAAVMAGAALPASSQDLWDAQTDAVPADRLCTAGFNPDYGWFSLDGFLGVLEFPGQLQQNQCVPDGFTTAPLKVQLGQLTLPLAEEVNYIQNPTTGAARVSVALAEPALCEDYFESASGEATWNFNVTDANGVAMIDNVRGVASLDYNLNTGALAPAMVSSYGTTEWLRCYSGLAPNAVVNPDTPTNPALIHGDGFEDPVMQANLQVEFLNASADAPLDSDVIEQSSIADSTVTYTVRVRNAGTLAANGVRVREFVPTASLALRPVVTRTACLDQGNGGAACSTGTGTTPFRQIIGTLEPGAYRDFTFTRRSSSTDSSTGQTLALVQVAAFAAPGTVESSYADNSRALRIRLVDQIVVTHRVSTDGSTANLLGGTIGVTSVPGGCSTVGSATTCPPGSTGLVFVAAANEGFTFTGFTGCTGTASGLDFTGGTFTTTVAGTCTLTANFRTKPLVTASVTLAGGGSVSPALQAVHYGDGNPATVADNAVLTVTPDAGKEIDTVTGDTCTPIDNGDGTWTVENVQANCHVSAAFKAALYTVNAVIPGGNGSVVFPASGQLTVGYGDSALFLFQPAGSTYEIASITDDCGASGESIGVRTGGQYLVVPITHSCTIEATFSLITHPVTVNGGIVNGSIDLASASVVHGSNAEFNLVPAVGYHYVEASIAGSLPCGTPGGDAVTAEVAADATVPVTGTAGPITQAGCELFAAFAINEYAVTVNLAGSHGTIGEVGDESGAAGPVVLDVNHGGSVSVRIFPEGGYHAVFQTVAGSCSFASNGDGTFTATNVTGHCEVGVGFEVNTYTVTASVDGGGGTISPGTRPNVVHGDTTTFTLTPASGHVPDAVNTTDTCGGGGLTGPNGSGNYFYTIYAVTSNCSVTAKFVEVP